MNPIYRRTIHPEIRIVDAKKGVVDYVASDETLDAYREVIRANGWRFTNFKNNAPFVDSHNYDTIDNLVGRVIDFKVEVDKLIERVQWAIDVPSNLLAIKGWQMTEAGYLKAVSVGFQPIDWVTNSDGEEWKKQLSELRIADSSSVRRIFTAQEQIELSACIIGANPNAIAKAFKAGILNDADLETISKKWSERETANAADDPADAALARQRAQEAFLEKYKTIIKGI